MLKYLRSSPITYSQYFIAKRHLASELVEKIPYAMLRNFHCIEVGPGKGRLTEFLSEKSPKLTAIEIDYNFWKNLVDVYRKKLEWKFFVVIFLITNYLPIRIL